MSKLADDIRFVFEHNLTFEDIRKMMSRSVRTESLEGEYPGVSEFKGRLRGEIEAVLRKGRTHFAGATPWRTGQDAIDATADHMGKQFFQQTVLCLARGIAVGRRIEDYQNYSRLQWRDVVYACDEWRENISLMATNISTDDEVMEILTEELAETVKRFGSIYKFQTAEGRATMHVWDLWNVSLGANSMYLYLQGVNVGKKMAEEEKLEAMLGGLDEGASTGDLH